MSIAYVPEAINFRESAVFRYLASSYSRVPHNRGVWNNWAGGLETIPKINNRGVGIMRGGGVKILHFGL